MTLCEKMNCAGRIDGLVRVIVFDALGSCVAAATIYDVGRWITVW
jgi:hypothetical protein